MLQIMFYFYPISVIVAVSLYIVGYIIKVYNPINDQIKSKEIKTNMKENVFLKITYCLLNIL